MQNKDKDTPLHLAAMNGHDSTVSLLLRNGANRTVYNSTVNTPLEMAIKNQLKNVYSYSSCRLIMMASSTTAYHWQ
jgi:ankyrin repeat protein